MLPAVLYGSIKLKYFRRLCMGPFIDITNADGNLYGPRELPEKCCRYLCMGPRDYLTNAAGSPVWAHSSI